MSNWLDKLIPFVDVPEGEVGDWKIERFEISKEKAKSYNLGLLMSFQGGRGVREGNYTRLIHDKTLIMSDTYAEKRDHVEFIRMAHGRVLINGLGLGMAANAVLIKPEVTYLRVIEIAPEVIQLVGTHLKDRFNGRLEIIQANALEYKPAKGERFDCVWHDIWPEINLDYWEEYKKLHRRWGHYADWQSSWGRYELQRQRKREGSYYW